jgi:hypothetical protein
MREEFEMNIEITGEKSLVESLEHEINTSEQSGAQVLEVRSERNEAIQAFGLGDLSTVVMTVKGLYYLGKFASVICELLKKPQTKISILTPYGSLDLTYREKLSEIEVRNLLRKLVEL